MATMGTGRVWLAVIGGSLLATTALAKHVYSWKDEKGVMHFSDQKPAKAATEVKATRVEVDLKTWVSTRDSRIGNLTEHYLRNHYSGPIEVELSVENGDNVLTDPPLPLRLEIPALSESLLFRAGGLNPGRYSYSWRYAYVPGSAAARPAADYVYELPFASETQLRIDQGFGGSFSHTEEYSQHAVDIGMPEGTPIRAARAGVVMEIEEDFVGSGTNLQRFGDRANYIRILHSDGSMAVYAHLQLESVVVSVGQGVNTGQRIAASGNTGYSTGPHLHFVIQRNAGMRIVSIPFKFRLAGAVVTPTQDLQLVAPPD